MAGHETRTNQEVYDAVSVAIRDNFFTREQDVRIGVLEMNYFSFCIGAESLYDGIRRGVYVKIPKADLYIEGRSSIMPISDQDRELARNEYESLMYLDQNWTAQDLRVAFPRPLGFLEEYNAIITERFYAGEMFQLFRKEDIRRRIPGSQGYAMTDYLQRLAEALARFHKRDMTTRDIDVAPLLRKMDGLVSRLGSTGADARIMGRIGARVSSFRLERQKACFARTLKGLDIRNVFVGEKGRIYLLDPGKMKEDWREMDLARFLVTCRILYWGSPVFFLRMSPSRVYEEQFLGSYYGAEDIPRDLLRLCMIKELLKHWEMAHVVLALKAWPDRIKHLIRMMYVDPFYTRQILGEMEQAR